MALDWLNEQPEATPYNLSVLQSLKELAASTNNLNVDHFLQINRVFARIRFLDYPEKSFIWTLFRKSTAHHVRIIEVRLTVKLRIYSEENPFARLSLKRGAGVCRSLLDQYF